MRNLLLLLANFSGLMINDQTTIDRLQAKLNEISDETTAIMDLADVEERDLDDDESARVDELTAKFDVIKAQLDRRQKIENQRQAMTEPARPAVRPDPQSRDSGVIVRPDSRIDVDPGARGRSGFRHFGEFASAVVGACSRTANASNIDPRLMRNAPTTYGSEGTDADGGHAVPPDFREEIMLKIAGEESLLSRTDQMVTSSNSIEIPKDESTPWQAAGGILTAWTAEAAQLTQSKPALLSQTVAANKLTTLVPITDELLEDAPSLNRYLGVKAPQKITSAVNQAIYSGDGSGKPEGMLTAASCITVAKETGQTAATVVFENILNMYSSMHSSFLPGAVWLAQSDVLPQLIQMQFPGDSSPVYLPNNTIAGAPFGTLFGRPLIFTEAAEALGTEGDIMFANMQQYMSVTKVGGVRADTSIHLFFDYDVTAFRFILRVGGKSWLDGTIASLNGGVKSNFVSLATRA